MYHDKTITQLIPCMTPMYNVFKNKDGSYFRERVCCLALCKDGALRSMGAGDLFDCADEADNFVCCCDEEGLTEYPTSKD